MKTKTIASLISFAVDFCGCAALSTLAYFMHWPWWVPIFLIAADTFSNTAREVRRVRKAAEETEER